MHFISGYFSSVGITKRVNQDSLCILEARCAIGNVIMAAVCDGMGGEKSGEVASKACIDALSGWFGKRFPKLVNSVKENDALEDFILNDWKNMIQGINRDLCIYGRKKAIRCGSTLSTILIFDNGRYILGHAGDSRIYEIREGLRQLTEDQSLVASQARAGIITYEQAKTDKRRSVLLECVGVSEKVNPMFSKGRLLKKRSNILLCSDGFCHELTDREIARALGKEFKNEMEISHVLQSMEWQCEKRGETDNITAVVLACSE